MKDIIRYDGVGNTGDNFYKHELPAILRFIEHYNIEMVVLTDKGAGSRYDGLKEEIIGDVTRHLKMTPV